MTSGHEREGSHCDQGGGLLSDIRGTEGEKTFGQGEVEWLRERLPNVMWVVSEAVSILRY